MRYLKHNRVKSGKLALSTLSVHVKCLLPPPPPQENELKFRKIIEKMIKLH